ncbi:MAG: Uma2 family endonuclease [Verrucomicrobia bacterium]|nr:Uma2 family endonuclease [Verrucomicrobiota bacterium]
MVLDEKALCASSRNDYEPDVVFFAKSRARAFTPDQSLFPVPDLVVEVLSPSTQANDRGVKFDDYERSGVREYWLINPERRTVEIFHCKEGRFERQGAHASGSLESLVLTRFKVEIASLFDS